MNWIVTTRNDKTDEWLLKQYTEQGDSKYLGMLFERYLHLVYGVCLKYLKDRETAKDSVMSIYQILHERLGTAEVKNFKGWLYVVTKNHCLMQLRKAENKLVVHVEIWENLHHSSESNEPEISSKNELHLKSCLDQLIAAQNECLTMFYFHEKSYKEIESITEYSFNEVKSHIQNGKRNLKNCLEKTNEE